MLPLDCRDRWFESCCGHGYSPLLFVLCYVISSLCDGLITRSEESYQVCVIYKPQQWRGLDPIWAIASQKNVLFLVFAPACLNLYWCFYHILWTSEFFFKYPIGEEGVVVYSGLCGNFFNITSLLFPSYWLPPLQHKLRTNKPLCIFPTQYIYMFQVILRIKKINWLFALLETDRLSNLRKTIKFETWHWQT